jgi:hypothetical protein
MAKKFNMGSTIQNIIDMKKFYIILVVLFMVNGAIGQSTIHTSTINTFKQSKHQILRSQHRTLNSIENVQAMMGNKRWKTSDIADEKKLKEPINHRIPQQLDLIQIFDSVYYWQWDTISTEWKSNYKISNIGYDAHNNWTGDIWQYWNGSTWENDWQDTYTYDANNNQTSELNQD